MGWGSWMKNLELRREIIRKNVDFLLSTREAQVAVDAVVQSRKQEHSQCRDGDSWENMSAVPVTSISSPPNSASANEIGDPALHSLQLQVLQTLLSSSALTEQEKRKVLEELREVLSLTSGVVDEGPSMGLHLSRVVEPVTPEISATSSGTLFPPVRLPVSSAAPSSIPLHLAHPSAHPELSVPSDAATHSSFEMGMLSERSITEVEEEFRSRERRDYVTGELASESPSSGACPQMISVAEPVASASRPLVDIEDVRRFLRNAGQVCDKLRRFGLPETSVVNKLPWHSPRPAFLAKGLEWPPDHFVSERERIEFNRNARKRKKYLMGPLPTWSFMLANFVLLAVLVYNPRAI